MGPVGGGMRVGMLLAAGMSPLIILAHLPPTPSCYPRKETFFRATKGSEADPWMVAASGTALGPALGFHYRPVVSKCQLRRGLGREESGICAA